MKSSTFSGADLGGPSGHQANIEPYIFISLHTNILDLKCLSCMSITVVKIQFDNTSTYKYSNILTLRSVTMLLRTFALSPPPLFKHSGSAPDSTYETCYISVKFYDKKMRMSIIISIN